MEKVIFWLTGKPKKSSVAKGYITQAPGVSGQLLTNLDGVSLLQNNMSVDQVDEEDLNGFL